MLKKIRLSLAVLFGVTITFLFLDFTGTIHGWMGWMAKIQFLPALLALNVAVVVGLILLTLIFGRIYCSVICPLGVLQDAVSRTKTKKNKYRYKTEIKWLRYGVLALAVIVFVAGVGSLVALLDPFSAYGSIASNLFAPIYMFGNNILAYFAERVDSYAFYQVEVWVRCYATFTVAVITLLIIVTLSYRGGRIYCNTICPVGTVLGFVSRFAIFRQRFDLDKCNGCKLCERNCKSSCIDVKNHTIDYSRCVNCFNCIEKCNKDAIRYSSSLCVKKATTKSIDKTSSTVPKSSNRRDMLAVTGALVATSVLKAQVKVDGGLAYIADKEIPNRQKSIVPAGSHSLRNFSKSCTGCQLCVSVCPNQVLRPAIGLTNFMQPEMSYERGYCRPECVKCSEVCPAGAIRPITTADKSATQIGYAVWIEENCVVLTDGVSCGNCQRHCPVGAITMVERDPDSLDSKQVPVVNVERCIGCGACENLCPSRPFTAIYVEGNHVHRTV